jgi:ABC-type antimicrobial peptide transport system permease subunit
MRTSGNPAAVTPQVRSIIASFEERFRNHAINPVTELMRSSISQERLLARLATGFGFIALLLAAVGLYGVMSYAVTRRTAEIGLRVALGAQRGDVVRMVLGDAMGVVTIGIIVGIPASLGVAQLLKAQLYGVASSDPLAMSIAVATLAISAAAAALSPALRASRIAPLLSLRQE